MILVRWRTGLSAARSVAGSASADSGPRARAKQVRSLQGPRIKARAEIVRGDLEGPSITAGVSRRSDGHSTASTRCRASRKPIGGVDQDGQSSSSTPPNARWQFVYGRLRQLRDRRPLARRSGAWSGTCSGAV